MTLYYAVISEPPFIEPLQEHQCNKPCQCPQPPPTAQHGRNMYG